MMNTITALDDEMLCYNAIGRICSISLLPTSSEGSTLDTSWSGMLLEYTKRRRLHSSKQQQQQQQMYPLWNTCLDIASHINRNEYYYIWKSSNSNKLPILAKCIISMSSLYAYRYKQVQQYNVSFGKSEQVYDMDHLLGISHNVWTIQYAQTFCIPTRYKEIEKWDDDDDDEVGEFYMTLKEVSMPELEGNNNIPKSLSNNDDDKVNLERVIRKGDEEWVFGQWYYPETMTTTKWGISSDNINLMLQYGSPDKENILLLLLLLVQNQQHSPLITMPMLSPQQILQQLNPACQRHCRHLLLLLPHHPHPLAVQFPKRKRLLNANFMPRDHVGLEQIVDFHMHDR